MNKMKTTSRIIVALASLSLVATFFLPFWFIFLIAPQYPEGLTMQIWLNKLTGQVEIINGLNHYIGMKHIKAEMFPEFNYLIYVVGAFILLGLVVALAGKRSWLLGFLILTGVGAIAALYDFWSWGYDYGHNLDPKAAIQVPGLYYQPPLIGHKTLLNFDAYSYPDKGGWIVVIAGLVLFAVWAFEFYKNRQPKQALNNYMPHTAFAALLLFFLSSCSTGPEKIAYGKDACDDCKMPIMDAKFGGEIITKKGKMYKFDDVHCLAHFLRSGSVKESDVAQTFFADYEKEGNFLKSPSSFFVQSSQLKSPMNGNAAAFSTHQAAAKKAAELSGNVVDWPTLYNALK